YGYHLVKVEDREEARNYSLEEDWDEIKTAALNTKRLEVLNQWIEELKKDRYVVINKDIL
ncbi:foldase, partial [bacterium]|nr:foldase [bacterium]